MSGLSAFRQERELLVGKPRIRTVAQIEVARAFVAARSTVQRYQGEEGGRWRVELVPGGMRLGRKNYGQENRSAERGQLSFEELSGAVERRSRYALDMTIAPSRPKRSTISSWSTESRRRMSYVLKSIDYTPLFDNGGIPALVTLTMPANWEQIAPSPKAFKELIEKLRGRYRKSWPGYMTGVWKLEFQRRGAPHVHILMTPPMGRLPGRGLTFDLWLAEAWADICKPLEFDANDVEQLRRYQDHVWHGTSIDYSKGLQDGGIDTVAAYFSKHGLFGAKDYQNEPPEIWREAVKLSGGVRFWGYWALKKARGVIELNPITPHYVS